MKVIMWDVDDVLNDLMGDWFRLSWLPAHPNCTLKYSGMTKNPPHELLGVTKSEYLASLDAFRQSSFKELKPLPEMLEWFSLYGNKAEHRVVTAVPTNAAHYSAEWVFRHFGTWIHSFNIVPSPREGEKDYGVKSKSEYIRTFSKVDLVVEDNLDTIRSMKELGIETVTIPRPWNCASGTLAESLRAMRLKII
jgi:FMN phosphatase YigB (HAD superfamily)